LQLFKHIFSPIPPPTETSSYQEGSMFIKTRVSVTAA